MEAEDLLNESDEWEIIIEKIDTTEFDTKKTTVKSQRKDMIMP